MKKKRAPKHLQSLLSSVVEILVDNGIGDENIRHMLNRCLEEFDTKASRDNLDSGRTRYARAGDLPADLLRIWHRDARYLDEVDAKPRPLQLSKGRNSIQALALSLDPKANLDDLMRFLTNSALIVKTKDGRYVPTTEAGAISKCDKFVAEHMSKSIVRFISTVRRNTAPSGGGPMIERFAYVADLDQGHIDDFCDFTRSQGHSYLQVVDDWMEQRRARGSRAKGMKDKRGVVAGVHVIAYVGGAARATPKKKVRYVMRGSEGSDRVETPTTTPPAAPA